MEFASSGTADCGEKGKLQQYWRDNLVEYGSNVYLYRQSQRQTTCSTQNEKGGLECAVRNFINATECGVVTSWIILSQQRQGMQLSVLCCRKGVGFGMSSLNFFCLQWCGKSYRLDRWISSNMLDTGFGRLELFRRIDL